MQLYPHMQVIPKSGLLPAGLFWVGPFWTGAGGQGSDQYESWFWPYGSTGAEQDPRSVLYRSECSTVLLRLKAGFVNPRVLLIGGRRSHDYPPATSTEVWDRTLSEGEGFRWKTNTDALTYRRSDQNTVLLPNGHVFLLGGQGDLPTDWTNICETFKPVDVPSGNNYGVWDVADTLAQFRHHHSVAVLLPDGRVMAAGSDGADPADGRTNTITNYEIYYPPYLFKSNGTLRQSGDRPTITGIQEHAGVNSRTVYYGHSFYVAVGGSLSDGEACEVVLMRPCAVTHGNDMNQRSISVYSGTVGSGGRIIVPALTDSTLETPGPYMVFVLDKTEASQFPEGIPSKARWIFLKHGTPLQANTTWSTSQSLTADFRVAPGETLYVDSGVTITTSGSDSGPNDSWEKDVGKVEILVEGVLHVRAATANRARFIGAGGGQSVWYGLRIAPTGKLVVDNSEGLEIDNARAAIAWEQMIFPDLAGLDAKIRFGSDESQLRFGSNYVPVSFDRDVTVAAGQTAQIPTGWTLGFRPGDAAAAGRDPAHSELIVLGKLLADGGSAPTGRITMKSAVTPPEAWYGLRFLDSHDDASISSVTNVDFHFPMLAVSLDSLSGNLFGCSFSNVGSAAVFVDRDTRVMPGYRIALDATAAPCTVLVNSIDPAISTHWGEDSARVEIIVEGTTETYGTATNRVVFRPNLADDIMGDDWHGITFRGTGYSGTGVGHIDHAEISHATYPITFYAADAPVVTNSLFHNYHDEAITDFASDAHIADNEIYPGVGASPEWPVGRTGIHIASSYGLYERNKIFYPTERGIWADFPSSWCSAPPVQGPSKVTTIRDNDLFGSPNPVVIGTRGIEVSWACKEETVDVTGNNIQGWNQAGIKLRQSADVQVDCNCVKGNTIGVLHQRNKLAYLETWSEYSLLRDNLLKGNTQTNVQTELEGPKYEPGGIYTAGIYGGAYTHDEQGSAGGNLLRLYAAGRSNWHLHAQQLRTDVAEQNGWRDESDNELTGDDINEHNLKDLPTNDYQTIDVTNAIPGAPHPGCVDDEPGDCPTFTPPSGTMTVARPTLVGPDEHQQHADRRGSSGGPELSGLPTQLALHPARPNPARQGLVLQMDIPAECVGLAELKLYDVTGRRVRTLLSRVVPAGRHNVTWDLTASSGERVSSGVYFARLVIKGKSTVQRVVVLE